MCRRSSPERIVVWYFQILLYTYERPEMHNRATSHVRLQKISWAISNFCEGYKNCSLPTPRVRKIKQVHKNRCFNLGAGPIFNIRISTSDQFLISSGHFMASLKNRTKQTNDLNDQTTTSKSSRYYFVTSAKIVIRYLP